MIQAFYRNLTMPHCRRMATAFAFAAGLISLPAVAQQAPQPGQQPAQPGQPAPRSEVFGDWTAICRARPDGSGENCVMGQTVSNQSDGGEARPLMQVVVGRLQETGGFGMRINIALAMGLTVPTGVSVGVDQNNPVQHPIQRCIPAGCEINIVLDQAQIAQFQRGVSGNITFQDFAGQPITLPFSLRGFTAAFNLVSS